MVWIFDQFADHGLYYSNVPVEDATKDSARESKPKAGRKTDDEQGRYGTATTHEKYLELLARS
jgi:hypothetical protein